MKFDLLLKSGIIVDPFQNLYARKDIAFKNGRVSKIETDIPKYAAKEIYNCNDNLVLPGLIDIHIHAFWGISHYGIDPDEYCLKRGVTTGIDAGSAGADTFAGFRKYVIEKSKTRLFSFLNISSIGMVTAEIGELNRIEYANVKKVVEITNENRDKILGIKVRLTRQQSFEETHKAVSRGAGIRPLYLAKEAAEKLGVPIMVHPMDAWCRSVDNILNVMGKGDIFTHCFHGREHGILGHYGAVKDSVYKARERGVIFDVGHGKGSFKWEIAEKALEQGFRPDIISSDLHFYNIHGPVYDLLTTLSKFICLGLSINEAFRCITATPKRVFGKLHQLGTLKIGALGDAVVIKIKKCKVNLFDSHQEIRIGKQKFIPLMVIKEGRLFSKI